MTHLAKALKGAVPLLAVVVALPLLFGYAGGKKMKMHKKIVAMKQEIEKHIRIGSNIEDAQRIMEGNGFECQFMERSSFSEREEEDVHARASHYDIDYLFCDKEKAGFICSRRWHIGIVHKNRIVSDILVSITETCP